MLKWLTQPTISGSDLEGFAFVPDVVSVELPSAVVAKL